MSDLWAYLLEPVDFYCERTSAALMSEPLNFVSNFAFFIIAWRIHQLKRDMRTSRYVRELNVLAILAVLVGAGSALFHSWATRLSQAADVLPIALFVTAALTFYAQTLRDERRREELRKIFALAILFLVLPVVLVKSLGFEEYFAKGEFYLGFTPTLLLLAYFEANSSRRFRLFLASGLFLSAYIFRTLDPYICAILPYGTHFLWHLFTTLSAYMMASIQAISGRLSPKEDRI